MCIIIAKQPNGIVTEDTLHHCWNANDDGAGFMYAKHNQLHIEKGFMKWDSFIERYRSVISEQDRKSTRLNSSHSQQSRMPSSA